MESLQVEQPLGSIILCKLCCKALETRLQTSAKMPRFLGAAEIVLAKRGIEQSER